MAENKLLLISLVFYPDEVAVANLFTNLSSVLVQKGMDVEVWCAQPNYTSKQKQPRRSVYEGIKIHYLRSSNFSKDKLTGRFLYYATFSISVVMRLLFSVDKKTVISHTTPPFLAILVSFICRLKNRRFIYILMDVFPDGLIRLGKASGSNILIRIWHLMHLSSLRKCSVIVVIGRDMKEWLLSIYPEGAGKISYIPLWQDEDLIKPISFEQNPFVSDHKLQEYFVVQYSGNMGLWNRMETIGYAVNENPDNVRFVFIGSGMRKPELIDSIENVDRGNILFLPFQENNDYSFSVSACHAAVVSLREGLEGMAVPSKIIGIMAAGIAVIALVPEHSEIAYIVKEENCGIVVDPRDTKGLLRAILELKSDENLRKKLGQNGRDAFLRKYTTKIIAESYKNILITD